jgi:hypothetical protein
MRRSSARPRPTSSRHVPASTRTSGCSGWHGALVFGDSFPGGPVPDQWLPEDKTRAQYSEWLAPLLELPVELVLPTHGDPGSRDLLERALS